MTTFDKTVVQRLIKVDIKLWQSGADNFTSLLFGLIQKADPGNQHKLRSVWPNEVEAYVRWQAEREKIIISGMLPVGSVMAATKDLHFCKAGEKAVIYEHYDRTRFDQNDGDNLGIGLIFPNGFYDGFSRKDLAACQLKPHHPPLPELADYTFINVQRLMQDYCAGVFDKGFAV